MAATVIIHRPNVPGSTMRVTAKAFRAAYAADGYVEGVRPGDSTPGLDHHHRADVARNDAQVAALQEQLRQVQADRDAIAAQHAMAAPALATVPPPAAAPPAADVPRTDNPPAKRPPRKRPPRKPAVPAADVPPQPSPGPPDIDATPALD